MKNDIKRFAIYSRKSKFTGKGESIENQIEMCRQYIASHYSEEEAESACIYEDEGFSGGTLERPEFKKMMSDSQEIKFDAIVVYRLDRISRNIGDFAKLIEDLGSRNIDFISIREQFDTSSPMGRAMMYIASVFSQLERETIAERIRDNMHELAKTGRWLGGTTPTGYASESTSNITADGKSHKACKLKSIPEEISIVKMIFDKFIETSSLTKTEQFLAQGGYRTKRGNTFTRFTIRGILSNPVYMISDDDAYEYFIKNETNLFSEKPSFDGIHGIMAYNRTLQRPGKSTLERPISEWIVSVGRHKGIIPGSRWVAVQKILKQNKSKSYRKPRSNTALLSGILCCSNCGDYMRPKMSGRLTAEGEPIYTYRCNAKERSHGHACSMKNANGSMLDAKIIEELKCLCKHTVKMADTIMQMKKSINYNCEEYDAETASVKNKIAENEKAIKQLIVSMSRSETTHTEEYIMKHIDRLHDENEHHKKHLAKLEAATSNHDISDIEFDITMKRLSAMSDNIDNYSIQQKRNAIRTLIRRVVWDGENAHVYLFGNDESYDFPPPPDLIKETSDPESPLCEDSK